MVEKLTEGYSMSVFQGRRAALSIALSLLSGAALAQESTDAAPPAEADSAAAYEVTPPETTSEAAPEATAESTEATAAPSEPAPAEEGAPSDTVAVEPITAPSGLGRKVRPWLSK